ncbi:hypothetical protein TSOC_008011, partial [Tetrabaena socialis]
QRLCDARLQLPLHGTLHGAGAVHGVVPRGGEEAHGGLDVCQEVGDLRKTLNTEVEGLRAEFLELKTALKQQLELTAGLASQEVNDAEARLAQLSAQQR